MNSFFNLIGRTYAEWDCGVRVVHEDVPEAEVASPRHLQLRVHLSAPRSINIWRGFGTVRAA